MADQIRREDAEKDPLVFEQPKQPVEDKRLTRYANYHGAYEVSAAQRGHALFTPLQISPRTAQAVPGYESFREGYELYKVPVHHSSVALGRVNDLHQTGAPRTPAEIPAATMKHFRKVDNVSSSTDEKIKAQAANQWIEQQDELHTTFDGYMASRAELNGAMAAWRSVQAILRQRSLEAKKSEALADKEKIDAAAEMLVKIVEVSAEALTLTVGLEAEIMEGMSETYTATAMMEEGKAIQTAGVTRKVKHEKMLSVAKKAGGQIGLKELFIIGMGDYEKYQRLQNQIAAFERQINAARDDEVRHHIDSAKQKLDAVKIQIKGEQRAFEGKRSDARNAAQAFGQAMNGREKTIMVTMMAEAYQELDLFGTRANDEAHKLNPKLQRVWNWLHRENERHTAMRHDPASAGSVQDFEALGGAATDVIKSRDLLGTEQPKWHQAATAWRHFLSDVMDKQFDPQAADVDAQRKVKPVL
ncbi:MAG: hypothetical protein KF773_05975 [Deltaproteobacteria bacterium]|nr:hypothetical protein [Deltaproteobacteria bacterium]